MWLRGPPLCGAPTPDDPTGLHVFVYNSVVLVCLLGGVGCEFPFCLLNIGPPFPGAGFFLGGEGLTSNTQALAPFS